MGTPFIHERKTSEALLNCAFITTENIADRRGEIFRWFMEMLMLGVGVGGDTRGRNKVVISPPNKLSYIYTIEDSREGWSTSVQKLFDSYIDGKDTIIFDYSKIRPSGEPIKGFGGIASGPEPLIKLHANMRNVLDNNAGKPITSQTIVDIFNMIGACVIAGNVRRSAEIMLAETDDLSFLDLKDYDKHPERMEWGWASNNSVVIYEEADYKAIAERIVKTGEPGCLWLNNVRKYGRMTEEQYDGAIGMNPCQPGFAKILTPEGIKMLDDINIGDLIWSEDGWVTVTNKWSTGIKPVYEYQSSFGTFIGTENHRLVSNGIKTEAKDCETIDSLAGQQYVIQRNPIDIMNGLLIGDGSIHKASNDLIHLIIGDNDQDYFTSEIAYLITKHRPGLSPKAYEVNTTLDKFYLQYKTYERIIPDEYYYGDANKICGFLRGLFSANGSVAGNRIQLKQSSHKLIRQVQEMLSAVGIRSYITINKPTDIEFDNGTYTCKQSYCLQITKDKSRFVSMIGFLQNYKNAKINPTQNDSLSTGIIQNIEYLGEFEVFDITVSGEHHTYWTGGLNVSNCSEIALESKEMCNLIEIYINNHDDIYDLMRTIKFAYLYGKTITLTYDWITDRESREVMCANRRVGLSITGIAQFITKHGINQLIKFLDSGYATVKHYDRRYSSWLEVNQSIRLTSIKPSGSVSLLAGATPGIHYPHSEYYIRRIRLQENSSLVKILDRAHIRLEKDLYSDNTVVAEFPIHAGINIKASKQLSIWQQLELTALLQRYWSDNSVSVTINFDPDTTKPDEIADALEYYSNSLKSVSMLPNIDGGAYAQMPYEEITAMEYMKLVLEIDFDIINNIGKYISEQDKNTELYCSNDVCEMPKRK